MNQNARRPIVILSLLAILSHGVMADHSNPTYACEEYPGVLYACSSPCYPNCGESHSSHYHVMMTLPNKAECYLNKNTFGSFRLFLPTTGILTGESDDYFLFNDVCTHNDSSAPTFLDKGSTFDGYFECDNNVRIYSGGGNIPNAEIAEEQSKRVFHVYTQTKLDICKAEFPLLYPQEDTSEEETEPAPEENSARHLGTGIALAFTALGLLS